MSYLNSLPEQLRPHAREIFPHDPYRCVNLMNTNRYTRIYLRRIILRVRKEPFNLKITDRQLARLFRVSRTNFSQWFCHDVHQPKVFRRVRWLLREIFIINIREDRGESDEVQDQETVKEKPIKWPNKKVKTMWKQQTEAIREEYQNRGPVIEKLTDAEELIRCMQSGYSSSSSFEDNCKSIGFGENPDEKRVMVEDTYESTELPGLNGRPVIVTEHELLDQFKNLLITSDKSKDISSDDEMLLPTVYYSLDEKLCHLDDDHSIHHQ
jgi:hypothetical protein